MSLAQGISGEMNISNRAADNICDNRNLCIWNLSPIYDYYDWENDQLRLMVNCVMRIAN